MKTPLLLLCLGVELSSAMAIAPVTAQQSPIRPVNEAPDLDTASGSVADLDALENRSVQDWSWGSSYEETLNRKSGAYQIGGQSATPTVDPNQEIQDWNNLYRGEPRERSSGIPLTQF